MSRDIPPAIVRPLSEEDRNTTILHTPFDNVASRRGWGDSGYKVEVVKHGCPSCDFDRMIRRTDVSPESETEVRYWCLNPNCKHYARDTLSANCQGSYPHRVAQEPTIVE